MTMECYEGKCPFHGNNNGDEGPFCFEPECRNPELVERGDRLFALTRRQSSFRRADIVVGLVSLFITGILVGMWLKPDPKFSACVEVPSRQMGYPKTKTEMKKYIAAYGRQGEGWK